ncbi:MAG: LysR substrate-binding domain-containing protein [Steroidobacteraceae bacterium]
MDRLAALRTFIRVAELRSFTAAADALGLSRAAVSEQVAELERQLGARLLNRTTRKVALTPDGAEFFERCLRVLGELDAAEQTLRGTHERPRGRLRVDVPIAFGRQLLLPALPQFAARYPDLALEIQLNDHVVDLVDEQIDCAIRLGPVRDPDLVARPICKTRWFTCAAPEYLDRAGRPRSIEELRRHRLIGFLNGRRPVRWTFMVGRQRQQVSLPCAVAFNMADANLAAALRGHGILQCVDMLVAEPLRAGRLERVLREHEAPGPNISAVFLAPQRNNLRIRVFADFAAELLQRSRAVLDSWPSSL